MKATWHTSDSVSAATRCHASGTRSVPRLRFGGGASTAILSHDDWPWPLSESSWGACGPAENCKMVSAVASFAIRGLETWANAVVQSIVRAARPTHLLIARV